MTEGSKIFPKIPILLFLLLLLAFTACPSNADATGRITGRVTDASSGLPIGGATVEANGIKAYSDPDGNFIFEIPAGEYTVTASADSYTSSSKSVTVTSGITSSCYLYLKKSSISEGKITASITDAYSRSPIAGATLQAGSITGYTDIYGILTFDLPAGEYSVTASADGYTPSSRSVTINSGVSYTLSFPLQKSSAPNGKITGNVKDTYSGSPIAGARVDAGSVTAYSGSDGTFIIDLPAGEYTITASADGYTSSSTSLTLNSGVTSSCSFSLQKSSAPNGKIAGTVTDAYSSNSPIAGAIVEAGSIKTYTGSDGSFIIDIPAGAYTVTASADGYTSSSTSVTVNSGATSPLFFSLQKSSAPNGKITGNVKDTYSGLPIAGARVDAGIVTAYTGPEGTFTMDVPAGTYTVIASADGYPSSSTSILVNPGATSSWSFSLQKTGSPDGRITGTVTNEYGGSPVAGARVEAGSVIAFTGPDGTFIIEIPAGTYTVTASADKFTSSSTSVTVNPGTASSCSFSLKKTASSESSTGEKSSTGDTSNKMPTGIEGYVVNRVAESIPGFGVCEAIAILVLFSVVMRMKKKR